MILDVPVQNHPDPGTWRAAPRGTGRGRDGFTLIEALAALAVSAVLLAAIGSLMAANIRGSSRIGEHRELVETLRAVLAELPDRIDLAPGAFSGERDGRRWQVDVAPLNGHVVNPRGERFWTPQRVVIKAQASSGALVQVETIRLRRRSDR